MIYLTVPILLVGCMFGQDEMPQRESQDACMNIRDEGECNETDSCAWGEMMNMGGPGGSGNGRGSGGRRLLQRDEGNNQGNNQGNFGGNNQGNFGGNNQGDEMTRMGCRSVCVDATTSDECSAVGEETCTWGVMSRGGGAGAGGRRRLQRQGNQGGNGGNQGNQGRTGGPSGNQGNRDESGEAGPSGNQGNRGGSGNGSGEGGPGGNGNGACMVADVTQCPDDECEVMELGGQSRCVPAGSRACMVEEISQCPEEDCQVVQRNGEDRCVPVGRGSGDGEQSGDEASRACMVDDVAQCPEDECEVMEMQNGQERCVPQGRTEGGEMGQGSGDMQERCMPVQTNNREPITTGIMLTMTIYTDQNCEELLVIDETDAGGRRLMRRLLTDGEQGNRNQGGGGRRTGGGQSSGGNDRQRNRFMTNPVERMLPVVDDAMNPKCSMDSRLDRENEVFRKSVCAGAGLITEATYSDAMCTEEMETDNGVTMNIMYDTCQPLPQRRQANNEGRRNSGEGEGEVGRRLSDEAGGWFERTRCEETEESAESNFILEGFNDLMERLTCEEVEDDGNSEVNPCEGLEDCTGVDGCFLNQDTGLCIWRNAPEGQGNFFVKYTWNNIIVDGVETDQVFCATGHQPADPTEPIEPTEPQTSAFASLPTIGGEDVDRDTRAEQYEAWCESVTDEAVCIQSGCKSYTTRRGCKPQNSKIKCKKLCKQVEISDGSTVACSDEDKAAVCDMYHDCNLNNRGKCTGRIRL